MIISSKIGSSTLTTNYEKGRSFLTVPMSDTTSCTYEMPHVESRNTPTMGTRPNALGIMIGRYLAKKLLEKKANI